MVSPIRGGILGRRYNRTLHGRSVSRKADVPGHNVVLGYSRPGTGDALDVFLPAGEPVYAMHDGRISRITDRGGRLSCVYVAGRGLTTVYAHLHICDGIGLGSIVRQGELVGWVGRKISDPHLHLEVWMNGRAVTAPTASALASLISRCISIPEELR
jgi:murein DD-endopeptidase MepM/ murein hydrolase activator NlpD